MRSRLPTASETRKPLHRTYRRLAGTPAGLLFHKGSLNIPYQRMNEMKIAIVGGTGNISQSITQLLLRQGHDVACCNRGISGSQPDGARHVLVDRNDRETFELKMRDGRYDAAIDMMCFSKEDAQSSIRAFRGVGHFVQCSTVSTYGIAFSWLPVTEDHPLHPTSGYGRGKVDADNAFLGAYYSDGFPVTIIKPSTTYGPKQGLLRQIALDFSWIDRIRKGKAILTGNGGLIHQFLHVQDAAKAFAGVLFKLQCLGQTYNMCRRGFTTWADYHLAAMDLIGRHVETISIPYETLKAVDKDRFAYYLDMFAFNLYFSAEKLYRDVPEFQPTISLDRGMADVLEAMDRQRRVPDSDAMDWEDKLIAAQLTVSSAGA
jgi:nucleoside-diphosphate-sugar epimerase